MGNVGLKALSLNSPVTNALPAASTRMSQEMWI